MHKSELTEVRSPKHKETPHDPRFRATTPWSWQKASACMNVGAQSFPHAKSPLRKSAAGFVVRQVD